jgi:DNA-binding GntR family transcriptional regulator
MPQKIGTKRPKSKVGLIALARATVAVPVADNLTARVTETLRQAIVDGEFQLGEALSESSLAAKLGVSRTPVREALTALQRQGLIVIRPQYGSFVFMPSEEDVAELCEFRRLMEVSALRFAYARRRTETLVQVNQALAAMDEADRSHDQRAYSRADALFHESIVENSANAFVIEAYKLVSGRVGALRSHNLMRADELRGKSTAAHRAIALAFERGDLAQAEEVIDEHVSKMSIAFRSAVRRGMQLTPAKRPRLTRAT